MIDKDGGPAFPIPQLPGLQGMTLRDYMAANALAPLINVLMDEPIPDEITIPEFIAIKAYAIADSMLKEREK